MSEEKNWNYGGLDCGPIAHMDLRIDRDIERVCVALVEKHGEHAVDIAKDCAYGKHEPDVTKPLSLWWVHVMNRCKNLLKQRGV